MDPITTLIATEVAAEVSKKILSKSVSSGWRRAKWLRTTLIRRGDPVRVSCSAFLRIKNSEQRYLTVRNLHRPEFYGPLGGCFKYFTGTASATLERFGFCADEAFTGGDTVFDLRGYIKRAKTSNFFHWFASRSGDYENARECLSRELSEELVNECNLTMPPEVELRQLNFFFVRSYLERTTLHKDGHLQFKYFEVYDLDPNYQAAHFLREFLEKVDSERLRWVSAGDIQRGRTEDQAIIGHATTLFISTKTTRPDTPGKR